MIPAPSELRACHDCGHAVLWTTTAVGKKLAVDPHPVDDGNQACYRASPRSWVSRSLDGAGARPPAAWEHRYRPHVATCTGRPAVQEPLPDLVPKDAPNVVRLDARRRGRGRRRKGRR